MITDEITLKNVHEYVEYSSVNLGFDNDEKKRVIIAYNEGGYAYVEIDAYELYNALKKIYEQEAMWDD